MVYLALDDAGCCFNLVMYKWDTSVKVNIHSFHLKRKALSSSGHLNRTAFWVQQKYGTQKGYVLKINHKFSKTITFQCSIYQQHQALILRAHQSQVHQEGLVTE
jgi:hypothetical protein